jgi:hypothetical protein
MKILDNFETTWAKADLISSLHVQIWICIEASNFRPLVALGNPALVSQITANNTLP